MKLIAILIMAMLPIMLVAEEVKLPSSVDRVLDKHEKAVDKIRSAYLKDLAAITDGTLKDLEKEQEKIVKSGDLELAMAVKAKIDEVSNIDPTAGFGDKVSLFGEKEKPKPNVKRGKSVDVSAAWGVELESVKKGQSINIQYVDGKWRSPSETDMENPNETEHQHLKLTLYGRINKDNRFEALKVINNFTEVSTYEFENDYQMIMLAPQINVGPVPNWNIMHQNTGSVKCKVAIE